MTLKYHIWMDICEKCTKNQRLWPAMVVAYGLGCSLGRGAEEAGGHKGGVVPPLVDCFIIRTDGRSEAAAAGAAGPTGQCGASCLSAG